MVFRAWPIAALLVLAACAGPAPQPGVTTTPTGGMTDYPLADTERFLVARLQDLGFDVEDRPETGVIAAVIERDAPPEWAFCDRIQVTDNQDGTLTVTFGEHAWTSAGAFPDGEWKVVLKDHSYTPDKDGVPSGYTWHWDDIIIK